MYEENGKYYIKTHFGKAPLVYIPEDKFDNKLIKFICDAKPVTIFDNVEIKRYQEEIVPRFLYELKKEYKEIYNNFVQKNPEYKEKEINFIGRKAYIYTLNNGSTLTDCHKNKWVIENDEIVCYKWKTWLPFNGHSTKTPTETRIKITKDMEYTIDDNSIVSDNTIFCD